MDGFGINKNKEGNAIAAAKTPYLDKLFKTCPHTRIGASGMDVGLPDGQMGNSEVGHTGVFEAAVEAVETVDECVGKVVDAVLSKGGVALITADHGNADMMVDPETGGPFTAHTTNPVPFIIVGDGEHKMREGGRLSDIAPTMLRILGLDQPAEMTGECLFTE